MTDSNPNPNPYVGPRAFQTGEKLYGRDRETRELLDLLIAERIVTLHSPSGAGKSSLIQAGLIPALEEEGFCVLPVVRVNLEPPTDLLGDQDFNRYAFSVMLSLEEPLPDDLQLSTQQLASLSLADYLTRRPKGEDEPDNVVLVFDQFEEVLNVDPTDQAGKLAFFAQLGAALRDCNHWVLFSLREDFVAALNPFVRPVPTRFANTYRLDLLGKAAARQAIQQPARGAGVDFLDNTTQKLVDDLRRVQVQRPDGTLEPQLGPYVEPVQLQVVCYRLWSQLPQDAKQITEEQLASVGDVDQSLAGYYNQCVAAVAAESGSSQRVIREWFDRHLITEGGFRGQVLMGEDSSNGLDNRTIWQLENAHLVRGEKRRGATWFELAHDRLIGPVRADNDAWFKANLSLLQQQADLWNQQGRPESLLLRDQELAQAKLWAVGHEVILLPPEVDFLAACQEQEERALRIKRRNQAISVLGVVAIILAFFAMLAYRQAAIQRDTAERQSRVARAGQLSAQSHAALEGFPPRSMLLAIEALDITGQFGEARLPAAEEALRAALKDPHGLVLNGHDGQVNMLAFSSDGHWLATGGDDGTAQLRDMSTTGSTHPPGNPVILSGHDGPVQVLAISPDGRWLATGSDDNTARLWDLSLTNPAAESTALAAHLDEVVTLAFSPDGRWLATGSPDLTARLWDLHTANPAESPVVLDNKGWVFALAFSPDSRWLATGSDDGAARLWDLQASNPAANPTILPGHERLIQTLAFSPDGRWLATGSTDHNAHLWDISSPESTSNPIVLRGHADWINTLAFSPDSHWLATGSGDKTIRLWDLNATNPSVNSTVLSGHTNAIRSLTFSPDGRWLATGSQDGSSRLWDLHDSNPSIDPSILHGHEDWVNTMAFSPDGSWLATGSKDGTIRLWDQVAADPAVNPVALRGHEGQVNTLAFSPDSRWLATGGGDAIVRRWDLQVGDLELLPGHTGWIQTLAISPDGRWLATGSGDGTARLWDLQDANPADNPAVLDNVERVWALAFSPNNRWLATGSDDGTAWLWNLETADPTANAIALTDQEGAVLALTFSPDGRWLATGGGDNNARLWDLQDTDLANDPIILTGHIDDIFTLAISPDGRWLATGSGDSTARLWDLQDPHPANNPTILSGHEGQVQTLAFSPDGRWLATGDGDGTTHMWNTQAADPAANSITLHGHEKQVNILAFSRDGTWLATGGQDGTARLWNLEIPDPANPEVNPVVLSGHDGPVLALAFSPDGRWLATGSDGATTSDQGTAWLWLLQLEDLKSLACGSAGRNLSPDEWQQYLPWKSYTSTCEQWPPGQ